MGKDHFHTLLLTCGINCHKMLSHLQQLPFFKYLEELLQKHVPARSLRSSSRNRLVTPTHRLKHSEKAFFVGGPKVWNALSVKTRESENISTFKANLKTELFKKVFEY